MLETLLQQVFNGISVGTVYALVAVGITTTLGLTNLVNFAYGSFITVGSFTAVLLATQGRYGLLLALPLGGLVVGVLLAGAERVVFRPTLSQPVNGFLISLGLIAVIENSLAAYFSTVPHVVQPVFGTVWTVGSLRMPAQRVFMICCAAVIFAILFAVLKWTWWGAAARAAAVDIETIELLGIPKSRVISGTFAVAGILAGIAGVLLAGTYSITPFLGATFIVKGFAMAIVGGLGSISGAIGAAFVLSIAESIGVGLGIGGWADALFFVLLYLVLVVRPRGLVQARA